MTEATPLLAVLRGRRVVLGVSGGIAAYKAVEVCRRLFDAGAHVIPVLTDDALRFVGEVTFSAVASEAAHTSLWDDVHPSPHTTIGRSADLVVVAPATARTIGRYAAGISDDLLTATLLATAAPVLVCPAMHTEMWEHPAVVENLATLRRRGTHVLDPADGALASGDVGRGRLREPWEIVDEAARILAAVTLSGDLVGVRVLVSAGGTREPIDPVRFIGNRSSGKQGYAIAHAAAARGASVTIVSTVGLDAPASSQVERVNTAAEMHEAMVARAADADIVVMTAAVADFRPSSVASSKIKKGGSVPEVVLEPTADILAALGAAKRPGQVLVGFAAETDDVEANARGKLVRKNLDLIVANDVSAPGVGFEHDTNAVTIFAADGPVTKVALASKATIANAVLDAARNCRAGSWS
jgi:phosphopantothenoylcysteine decarboxylase/phosphopantothenate--cysteine ligase